MYQKWQVEIRLKEGPGYLVTDYYKGLTIQKEEKGNLILIGELPDVSAVYGLIIFFRDLGIDPLSIKAMKI